ncbi:MAG TPA: diacylglycerol kinase family protein [Candidatus Limnocylindrales bacterium]|nr:diacylglycerol kinase family protein [Candidatus Limnocylindrales bacterium]
MEAPATPPVAPLVVVNPVASKLAHEKRRGGIVDAVVAAVAARTGQAPDVAATTREAAAVALAAARHAPLVAVVGGDGTLREAAAALSGTGVPLAIVPAGTGNVFAAELGVPRGISGAIEVIRAGRPRPVDLGLATWGSAEDGVAGPPAGSNAFVVACGVGFDARVMARASAEHKRRLGFGAYIVAAIHEAASPRPTRFTIEADDETHEATGLVALVANCGQIIPGFVGPRHPIDPADGLLDVIVVTATTLPGGLLGAAEALLARGPTPHRHRRSLRLRAARVRITADPEQPVQVDGDAHRAAWLEARVNPGAITILRR